MTMLGGELGAPPQTTDDQRRRTRAAGSSAELILREEIRSIRELWMRILQWGITVITGAGTVVFYARRAIRQDMVDSHVLKLGEPLPFKVYIIGTVFLLLLAFIFTELSKLASSRYRSYVGQLPQINKSGIYDLPGTGKSVWILPWLFYIFPAFDLLLRIYNFEVVFGP
jgi:hypothetical protein